MPAILALRRLRQKDHKFGSDCEETVLTKQTNSHKETVSTKQNKQNKQNPKNYHQQRRIFFNGFPTVFFLLWPQE
jgi:hypothetical protein